MEESKQFYRYLMLFYFRKGKSPAQTKKKICDLYGRNAVNERTCQNWFAKFRLGDTTCEDSEQSGKEFVMKNDEIKKLLDKNPRYTTRDIAEIRNVSQKTVVNHLQTLGYVSQYDIWVPQDLSEKMLLDRISICDSLLKLNESNQFLKHMITGDEKWIVYNSVYNNVDQNRSRGKRNQSQQNINAQKVMLCIWWDWKGIVHYELLRQHETIDSNMYCAQLDRLKAAINEKRPELVGRIFFHQDHAKPHISLATRQKLLQFGWDVLPHPPHSPDLAPTYFHVFRSLQNSLSGKDFTSVEACQNYIEEFFAEKPAEFWEDGIFKLPERWRKVIEQNGETVY